MAQSSMPENKKELWNLLDGITPKAEDQQPKIKYVLTGTFVTNGHELRVLAHSLMVPKPPSSHVPNTTRRKLMDVKMILATEDQIYQEFPDQSSFTAVGIDPGICNTATATIISSDDENVMQNMSVPRSGDAFSMRLYRSVLQRAKQQRQFTVILPPNQGGPSRLNPIGCDQAPAGQAHTWSPLSTSVRTHRLVQDQGHTSQAGDFGQKH
ncbi:hypothetical protein EDD21DRAFT_362755 [Dissophora ornata]|nr:hypothetical protein EDD21DRAFT_362755 [Dissophora ornata]